MGPAVLWGVILYRFRYFSIGGTTMAVTVVFTPHSMTAAQFDEITARLARAGAERPAGRLFHVCDGIGDQLRVIDVWESGEQLELFAQTLMPILQDLGIDVAQPAVSPVHHWRNNRSTGIAEHV